VKFYILTVVSGRIGLHGPYPSSNERDEAAKGLYLKSDLIARLDIDGDGLPTLEQYDIRLIDPMAIVFQKPQLKVFPERIQ